MKKLPVIYLPHGGGPLPILDDPSHASLNQFLKRLGSDILSWKPKAILVISAHWEEEKPTIDFSETPELIFDYSGFPDDAYQIKYPALGSPKFAKRVWELLDANGHHVQKTNRGFDHGVFIPMKIALPEASIPILSLSLAKGLDPKLHIEIGKAIASIREEGVLIVGSGMSYHNMPSFFTGKGYKESYAFDEWLQQTLCFDHLDPKDIEEKLIHWKMAPFANFCHPREEHLLPLHVCFGVTFSQAKVVFDEELLGKKSSGFFWE